MKRVAVALIVIVLYAGCIHQPYEKPELKIKASTELRLQKILLEVQVGNTGKPVFHDVTVKVDLPHGFTCEVTEYYVDLIEAGETRTFHFEITSPDAPEGEYTLSVHIESDELTVEQEFTFLVPERKEPEKDLEPEEPKKPEYTHEKIFGAQYDPSDIYNTDVSTLIHQLKEAGVNTLIFRVFDYEYEPLSDCGVYFETDHAPVKKDLLKEVVEKAHKENIHVFAWMTTLDCPWILADHPEWGVVAYDWDQNEYITNASWWLRISPYNRGHWEYLKKLYTDLAQYDIEGVVFQDDLYLTDDEDFSSFAKEAYKREFGKPLLIENLYDEYGSPTPEGEKWIDWKCETLMKMCEEIIDSVHTVNPDCKFLIDLYYDGVYQPENCRLWYSQDAELAIQSGFDYLYVMSYHYFVAGELGLTIEEAIDLLAEMTTIGMDLVGPDRLIMKVQVYDWFTDKPVEDWEIERAYTVLVGAGCLHIAYTPHHDQVPFGLIRRFAPRNENFCCV